MIGLRNHCNFNCFVRLIIINFKREKNIGNIPPNNKEITIDGFFYISITEASRQLNIPTPTILWRLNSKNPKFNNYKYVDIEETTTQPFEIL
jgi:hypothetical protein